MTAPVAVEASTGAQPRWKIACCNWGHDGIVKFVVYLPPVGDFDLHHKYTYTYAEALAYIEDMTPKVAQRLGITYPKEQE